jgi:FdhD protein
MNIADGARPGSSVAAEVQQYDGGTRVRRDDRLATEEPMEIRLVAGRERRTVAITMRTPGNDFELAAGFLYAEGIVRSIDEIERIVYCTDRDLAEDQRYNVVTVDLARTTLPNLEPLERHFTTSSACGVCGKASLEALAIRKLPPLSAGPVLTPAAVAAIPDALRSGQGVFEKTGGLHAAALFDAAGSRLALREDVGRHNALDKLVGWALMERRLPLHDRVIAVSGRSSYEIVQKALVAGAPIVCAISAPSSLAVDLARAYGQTLIGFIRGERFNVYAGGDRIVA